jgi:nucleotide-binding universal stress UspA family protein
MLPMKHILFPVDFSEQTQAAAPHVAAMAKRFGAEVTLIGVIQPFWEPVGGLLVPAGAPMLDLAAVERNLDTRLRTAFTEEFAGVVVHHNAQLGDPAQSIIQLARSEGVDLIMMPTHGYGPFRALLLGSVAAKVLHDAECPVWTAAHLASQRAQAECRTILCAVDASPKSVPVVEWASQFAAASGASLRLVHVVPGVEGWPERQMDREFQGFLQKSAREGIEKQLQSLEARPPLCVVLGNVAEAIRDEALRRDADLVVIGRGVLDETLGRLRTHAHAIIRQSPCPVLSV